MGVARLGRDVIRSSHGGAQMVGLHPIAFSKPTKYHSLVNQMKTTIRNIGSATILGVMLITTQAILVAQTAVDSTTTTTTATTTLGTISSFSPATIVIKTETSSEPVRYTYTKTTTYVDENGAPVSLEVVKSGLPVTVFYVKDGNKMVASKVVVRKAIVVVPTAPVILEKKTTTTTTTENENAIH